jgi:gliding motility-associated-like protein
VNLVKKQIFLGFVLGLLTHWATGQTFHIRCLGVGSGGDVTVTWDRTNLAAADFRCFYLLHSTTQAGPFNPVDSVFIFSDTIETHPTANASNNPAWYIVVYKSLSGGPDLVSDTVRAIQLTVLNPGSGFANLAWNVMHQPLIATHSEDYLIYREYPRGIFTRIDSVDALTAPNPMLYSDLISICDDTINYRIEVMDISGCYSVSNVDGDLFRDLQPPSYPELDSVTVGTSGNAIIGWSANPSPDTRAFVILQGVGSIWTPIDTVFGNNGTFFFSSIDVSDESTAFEIIAVDSCGNPSAQSQPHSTIYLEGNFLLCTKAVALSWNPYPYWGNPLSYEIYRSESGGPESLIGSSNTTSFIDSTVNSGTDYCYRIIAREIGTNRSSTSSRYCILPVFPPPPDFCTIRKVSVLNESQINIVAYVDPNAVVSGYELLRSTNASGPFRSVAIYAFDGSNTISFIDDVPSTASSVYYYQVVTMDSCGLKVKSSEVCQTILLTGESMEGANDLSWTDYATWPTGVSRYLIFRSINGLRDPDPIAIVTNGTIQILRDSVLDEFYSDGKFCYVVQAVEAPGNPDFFLDSAASNEICLLQQPTMFIPNAFHPGGGFNEIFRPYPVFVSDDNYSFEIYDRWGRILFSTNDPQVGWDGSIDGEQAPEAVYVYLIESKQPDGSTFRRVGRLTLIR